jgi:hypothetical protein
MNGEPMSCELHEVHEEHSHRLQHQRRRQELGLEQGQQQDKAHLKFHWH